MMRGSSAQWKESSRHKNKRARGFLLELSKVAATYSPTTQCSTIGDAVSLLPSPSPLRYSPLSPAPARRRRAHRRPPRASDALREGFGATHSWDIKDMVSLKKVSLSFSSDHWAHEVIVELVASWEV